MSYNMCVNIIYSLATLVFCNAQSSRGAFSPGYDEGYPRRVRGSERGPLRASNCRLTGTTTTYADLMTRSSWNVSAACSNITPVAHARSVSQHEQPTLASGRTASRYRVGYVNVFRSPSASNRFATRATSQLVLLQSSNWTSAETFFSNGLDDALNRVTNPDGSITNLIFDVHNYLDFDNSYTCLTW